MKLIVDEILSIPGRNDTCIMVRVISGTPCGGCMLVDEHDSSSIWVITGESMSPALDCDRRLLGLLPVGLQREMKKQTVLISKQESNQE